MDHQSSDIAILYYTRTGHSKRLADAICRKTDGKLYRIDAPGYPGVFGFVAAAVASLTQRLRLRPQQFEGLDRVPLAIVCGPVWTDRPAVPLRGLLRAGHYLPGSVAVILTCGSAVSGHKALTLAEKDFGAPFEATATLPNSDEGKDAEAATISAFIEQVQACLGTASLPRAR